MRSLHFTVASALLMAGICSCGKDDILWVSSTYDHPWQKMAPQAVQAEAEGSVLIDRTKTLQAVEGFGTCFNELGWTSLSLLSEEDRGSILQDLFSADGLGLTMGRMPLGANDFSIDYYSYADVPGDLALEHFSINHDRATLIPFIKAAQAVNPELKIWASPWCPPQWMKVNGHYANTSTLPIKHRFEAMMKELAERPDDVRATGGSTFGLNPAMLEDNGLPEDKQIREGQDAFRLEDAYLEAYARYFGKFVDAYKSEGIDIKMGRVGHSG